MRGSFERICRLLREELRGLGSVFVKDFIIAEQINIVLATAASAAHKHNSTYYGINWFAIATGSACPAAIFPTVSLLKRAAQKQAHFFVCERRLNQQPIYLVRNNKPVALTPP